MQHDTQAIIDLSRSNKENENLVVNPIADKEHKNKVKAIWKFIGKIALLVLSILALARVPFVGSYLDGLFDYLFALGKYPFYLLIIFVLIGWIFSTGYTRIIKTKRFIIFSSIALLSICCIISGVSGLIFSFKQPTPFPEGMATYHTSWVSYFTNWHYSGYFHGDWITGGILAELLAYVFAYLSSIVLIVVAAVLLVICVFVILNVNYRSTRIGLKIRSWMVRKLGGSFKYDGYNELKAKRDNQNKFKKTKKIDVEAIALRNSSIPFELLPDTDLNKHAANFKHARNLQNKLTTLFRNNDIDCVPTDINVYCAFSEICFEAKNKTEVKSILNLQDKIAKVTKLDHFNISLRGNIINIEIENVFFSKMSLKTVFDLYKDGKDVCSVFGLTKQNELCKQNFRNSPSALILGKKGSGSATLAVLMALSTCYITTPDELELVILNPNCESTYQALTNLPHTDNKVYETLNVCTEKLHDIQKIVNDRNSLLKVNNVDNIDQYNKIVTNTQTKLKHVLVLISNFDCVLRETFQNNKILSDILVNGRKAGVYLVLQSYVVNNDIIDPQIYDNISNKYILTLSSREESIKIFDNFRGYQLHGNGDCLTFSANKIGNMKRVQICNLNFNELVVDVDIVKTFYLAKDKQRAEMILSGEDNEKNR